jgi:hypothetical protein
MAVDRTTDKEATLASLKVGREMFNDDRNWGSTRGCTIRNDNMTAMKKISLRFALIVTSLNHWSKA